MSYLYTSDKAEVSTLLAWGFSLQKPSRRREKGGKGEELEKKRINNHMGPNLNPNVLKIIQSNFSFFSFLNVAS